MNKKILRAFLAIVLLFSSVAGCNSNKETISEDFVDKEWLFYDANVGEHFVMRFGSDGSFSYYCQCGEPVGDSDLYETYEYDAEKDTITIFNPSDKLEKELEIISSNEYHLLLNYDGDLMDFNLFEVQTDTNFFSFEGYEYFAEYDSRCIVVEMSDEEIVYGPVSYDPEGAYRDGPFEKYRLAENVEIYSLTVESYNSIQEEQQYEEFYEVTYDKLDLQGAKETTQDGAGYAFLWFDEKVQVKKIVFYGQLSVTADYKAITIPAEFCEDISREYLDSEIDEGLYDAAHIHEDGVDEVPQQVIDNLEYMSKMYGLYSGREMEEIVPVINVL